MKYFHMIVEQTYNYPMRMIYNPINKSFMESKRKSFLYERGFNKLYGWIKESGTHPKPHHDCILMTEKQYDLGDEVEINVIGIFKRADFDHKYLAVELTRNINDLAELSIGEINLLRKLYPNVKENEGWFGRGTALYCMENHKKVN